MHPLLCELIFDVHITANLAFPLLAAASASSASTADVRAIVPQR